MDIVCLCISLLLVLFFWRTLTNTNVNEYSMFQGQIRCINFELNKAQKLYKAYHFRAF